MTRYEIGRPNMLKIKNSFIIGIMAILTVLTGFLPQAQTVQAASDPVTVSLSASSKIYVNTTFTVPVEINEVALFNAANYRVTFDSTMLSLVSVTDGTIGTTTIPVDGYKLVQDGVCNIINYMGGIAGVSGSGTLAVLNFKTLSTTGTTTITLSDGVISNTSATEVEAVWNGASIAVAKKSTSGGGGGGGGGSDSESTTATTTPTTESVSTPAVPVLDPGYFDPSGFVDSTGKFIRTFSALSEDNQASLEISAGILGYTADGKPLSLISILKLLEQAPAIPSEYLAGSSIYNFAPDGAKFDQPVTIAIYYDSSLLPDDFNESDLFIAWYDTSSQQWVKLSGSVDTDKNIVSAQSNHFTDFAVLGQISISGSIAEDPNQFDNLSNDSSEINTDIPVTPASTQVSEPEESSNSGPSIPWILLICIAVIVVILIAFVLIRKHTVRTLK